MEFSTLLNSKSTTHTSQGDIALSLVNASSNFYDLNRLLLSSLPTAEQLMNLTRNTPACLARQAILADKKSKQELQLSSLIISYSEWLEQTFLTSTSQAVVDGLGFLCIDNVYLPGSGRAPEEVYWSGLNTDPKAGGCPKVMLLTGKRAIGSMTSDPRLLPGGKSSLDLLAERISCKGYQIKYLFDRGAYRVFVIWDEEAWITWYNRMNTWRSHN